MDQAAQVPLQDHIDRFWRILKTEKHVRLLVDMRRDHEDGSVHWDSSSFSDEVAKALVEDRIDAAEESEAFIQAEIDNAPEPLKRLGAYLADVLDEDQWKHIEPMLLGAATSMTTRDQSSPNERGEK